MITPTTRDKHELRDIRTKHWLIKDLKKYHILYLMLLPAMLLYFLLNYGPMYGILMAFKDFAPKKGIIMSPWTDMNGLKHFISFFEGQFFWRLIRNTFLLSLYGLIFGFPAPIILALLLNEIRGNTYKRTVQTITYLPYFISVVIICGMLKEFGGTSGVINDVIVFFGGKRANLLGNPAYFRTVYVLSDIWQGIGWGSILYLAALTAIDPQLYEAAVIDGANRWRQTYHVTLPGIAPTIIIMLILRVGALLSVGYEKIILLYNPGIYETADVISSYVFRRGIVESGYSFSTAVGLFNSVVSLVFVWSANAISRKVSETSLW